MGSAKWDLLSGICLRERLQLRGLFATHCRPHAHLRKDLNDRAVYADDATGSTKQDPSILDRDLDPRPALVVYGTS